MDCSWVGGRTPGRIVHGSMWPNKVLHLGGGDNFRRDNTVNLITSRTELQRVIQNKINSQFKAILVLFPI